MATTGAKRATLQAHSQFARALVAALAAASALGVALAVVLHEDWLAAATGLVSTLVAIDLARPNSTIAPQFDRIKWHAAAVGTAVCLVVLGLSAPPPKAGVVAELWTTSHLGSLFAPSVWNSVGVVMAPVAAFAAAVPHSRRWLAIAIATGSIVGISGSRVAALALLVSVVALRESQLPRTLKGILLMPLVLGLAAHYVGGDVVSSDSIMDRVGLWRTAAYVWATFPLGGVGFGGFAHVYDWFRDPASSSVIGTNAHNSLLSFAVSSGMLGAAVVSGWSLFVLRQALQRHADVRYVAAGVCLLVTGLAEDTFVYSTMTSLGTLIVVSPFPWIVLAGLSGRLAELTPAGPREAPFEPD